MSGLSWHLLSFLIYTSEFPSSLSWVTIRHSKERSGIRKSKKALYYSGKIRSYSLANALKASGVCGGQSTKEVPERS